MNAITPLMRAILDTLDTAEQGLGFKAVLNAMHAHTVRDIDDALRQLISAELVNASEAYTITEAGCAAR